jgi:hypothetical protein
MPEDTGLMKPFSNGNEQLASGVSLSLEEFDQLLRERIHRVLTHFDPPPELWKRIKVQAQRSRPIGNTG